MLANIQMVIVSLLNVSNPECLNRDNGYITQRLIDTELATQGHKFKLLAPVHAREPFETHLTIMGHTKNEVRFGANYRDLFWTLWSILKRHGAIDWIVVNRPEIIAAIRAIIYEPISDDTRIFTFRREIPGSARHQIVVPWHIELDRGKLNGLLTDIALANCVRKCGSSN